MDSYLHKIPPGGKGYIEFLNTDSFPSWTEEDEGRLVYNIFDDNLYFGTNIQWITISNAGWISRLLPSGGSTGQVLTKSSPSNYHVNWTTGSGGGGGGTVIVDQNPVGAIIAWPTDNVPMGFLECNGQSLLRSQYPELFAVIGTSYGNASGTTFNLPDYRGYFLRGHDGTAGNDPDKTSRTNRGDGTVGNNIGTKQVDEFKSHVHKTKHNAYGLSHGSAMCTSYNESNNNIETWPAGGNETRPKNIYVKFCIKYTKTLVQEVPSGTIIYSASVGTPSGFENCDGAALSRSSYSELFNSIGLFFSDIINVYSTANDELQKLNPLTGNPIVHGYSTGNEITLQTSGTLPSPLVSNQSYWVRKKDNNIFTLHTTLGGANNGTNRVDITSNGTGRHFMYLATSFKLPDLRGQFIRGFDSGAGIDQNRIFGSFQEDEFKSHTHVQSWNNLTGRDNDGYGTGALYKGTTPDGLDSGATGGNETRPKNISLHAYIKW